MRIAPSARAARFVGTLLHGADARDPTAFAAAGLVQGAVGHFAGWLPTCGVASIDTVEVLGEG